MTLFDGIAKAYAFCPRCRSELGIAPAGGRPRPTCKNCGFIQYLNPAPGAGAILWRDGRVCLVQRRFPPKVGEWTLPTGFQEWDEDIAETAVREVLEETGLEIRLTGLFAVHTGVLPPDQPVTVVFYNGEETGGELQAGDDAAAVGFFALDDLPGPIAFAAHRKVLRSLGAELEEPS